MIDLRTVKMQQPTRGYYSRKVGIMNMDDLSLFKLVSLLRQYWRVAQK